MNTQLLSIKAKKFGVRLAAFRQNKGLTTEVLSQWTGIAHEKLKAIEQGESTITLPELEMIALKLGFATETLIEGDLQTITTLKPGDGTVQQYSGLRDRMIALILRKTRTEQNLSVESVAANCGMDALELNQYESGVQPIPLPILECLCGEYQIPLLSLTKQKISSTSQSTTPEIDRVTKSDLPDNVSEFVNNPVNLPYLELARKLSELDAAKLRSIAEGLLEITY